MRGSSPVHFYEDGTSLQRGQYSLSKPLQIKNLDYEFLMSQNGIWINTRYIK